MVAYRDIIRDYSNVIVNCSYGYISYSFFIRWGGRNLLPQVNVKAAFKRSEAKFDAMCLSSTQIA